MRRRTRMRPSDARKREGRRREREQVTSLAGREATSGVPTEKAA